MDTFAILGFVFGLFGLIAFGQVSALKKQVYLLRLDLKNSLAPAGESSCGCGDDCGCESH